MTMPRRSLYPITTTHVHGYLRRPRGVSFIHHSTFNVQRSILFTPGSQPGTFQPPNIAPPVVVKESYVRAGPLLHPIPHLDLYFPSLLVPRPALAVHVRASLWITTAMMRYCTLSSSRPRVTHGSAPTPTILQLACVCAMMQVLIACSRMRILLSSPLNVLCALWI